MMKTFRFDVTDDDAEMLSDMCEEKGWKFSVHNTEYEGTVSLIVFEQQAANSVQLMLDSFAGIDDITVGLHELELAITPRPTQSQAERSGYVLAKARHFVQKGPETYRQQDFFTFPDESLSNEDLAAVSSGMAQLAEEHGWILEDPLSDIGVSGASNLIRTLHFEITERESIWSEDGASVVDRLACRHVVDGRAIQLFNRVLYQEVD